MADVYDNWAGQRPVVVLMCSAAGVPGALRREILLGMEEEGVPVAVVEGEGEASDLGFEAARLSSLEVGVGLDARGMTVLQHRKLHRHQPLLTANLALRPETARQVGINAARLVKVLPLKPF